MTNFVSPHNTEAIKYTGKLAVVTYTGPKIKNVETGAMMMHTNDAEPIGEILFADNSTYKGGLKEDMLHGTGVFTSSSGECYDGQFIDDQRHGFALFQHMYGTYEGYYENNKRNGKGKEVDNEGNVLEGIFENGDCIKGKMKYKNGDVYIGQFNREGDRHGQGTYTSAGGTKLSGRWHEDQLAETRISPLVSDCSDSDSDSDSQSQSKEEVVGESK